MTVYKFRQCFLDTGERCVVRGGSHLEMTLKAFDVLQLLVERAGEIVTKEEILDKVWSGSFVEEGNLPVHVSKLRRTLGESNGERFIETVPGTGYRFTAPVETVSSEVWRKQLSGNGRRRTDKSPTKLAFDSIAVLPMRNESDDPEIDYLVDGLTESFINSLSRLPDIKVIARDTVFRYKNKGVDPKEVGETLGVATVLSGRIKVIKNRLMISVELINVEDLSQIWGTQFNQPFSDIINIQEEITLAVSEKLRSEIGDVVRASLNNPVTQHPESYRVYLKGKYFEDKHTESDLYKAIEYFQQSVSFDPANIHSYVGAVECYRLLYVFDHISYKDALTKINPILEVLSKLNQSIDVLQVVYGELKFQLYWEFEAAENHIRRALAINPKCVIAHFRYSELLVLSGRFSEALEELQTIMQIDPLSPLTYKLIGRIFVATGQYENAIVYFRDAHEMEPTDYEALTLMGGALAELGRYSDALDAFKKAISFSYNADIFSLIGYVYALDGRTSEALKIIGRLKSESEGDRHKNAIKLARIYVALGENNTAYKYLDKAFNRHEVDLVALSFDARFARIRHERRFKDLAMRVGLPVSS